MPDCANAATVFEGAENGFAGITVHVSSGYDFISSTISADPPFHSFHFTHPGFAEQWMTLNNVVVPQFNTVLRFKSMLRSATPDQAACVQISNNGGAMWIDVFAQAGDGTAGEATFSDRLVSLGALAGQVVRIRFLYALTGGSGLTQTTDSFGWFVDQITVVSGAIILFEGAENGLAGVSVQVPGGYNLISSTIYSDFPFHSFHFAHPQIPPSDQWLLLNTMLLPQAGSSLKFKSMLRASGTGQVAHVQISSDAGLSWQDVFTQLGNGNPGEPAFTPKAVDLTPFFGRCIRVRFLYSFDGTLGGFFGASDAIGWFLDQIEVSNVAIPVTGPPPPILSPLSPLITMDPMAGGHYLEFSYRRRFDVSGVSFVTELSADLLTWRSADPDELIEITPPSGNPDWRDRDDSGPRQTVFGGIRGNAAVRAGSRHVALEHVMHFG